MNKEVRKPKMILCYQPIKTCYLASYCGRRAYNKSSKVASIYKKIHSNEKTPAELKKMACVCLLLYIFVKTCYFATFYVNP